MRTLPITVVEVPTFVNKAADLLSDEERGALIGYLAENPEAGAIMKGTGGVRKVRWARKNEGTSGGFRVVFYFYTLNFPLFALTLYPKSEKDNLTQGERNELKKLVDELIKNYKENIRRVRRR